MDPTQTLKEILEIAMPMAAEEIQCNFHTQSLELAEKVLDLHEWLSRGGFLPRQWQKGEKNADF